MFVSDVLHSKGHEVVTVNDTDHVASVVALLASRRIGAVVVEHANKPVGIFSERDLVNSLAKTGASTFDQPVSELMTSPMISGSPTDRIEKAMAVMTSHRIRHLPIMDGGDLVGLISIGDLVKHRLDEKELEANVLLDISRMRA